MSVSNTKLCDIDKDTLHLAKGILQQYGIQDFFYGLGVSVSNLSDLQFKKLSKKLPSEMLKARYALYSSNEIFDFRCKYLRHFASHDEAFTTKPRMGLSILPAPSGPKRTQFSEFLSKYNIQSRALWQLPVRYHSGWTSIFLLYSRLSEKDLSEVLSENMTLLEHQLTLYSSHFNSKCISQLNPITNFSYLSDKAIKVMKMTADGYSSEEIAVDLCLSESGVNYHLDRLRELLNARNRTQMISLAHTLGIIE